MVTPHQWRGRPTHQGSPLMCCFIFRGHITTHNSKEDILGEGVTSGQRPTEARAHEKVRTGQIYRHILTCARRPCYTQEESHACCHMCIQKWSHSYGTTYMYTHAHTYPQPLPQATALGLNPGERVRVFLILQSPELPNIFVHVVFTHGEKRWFPAKMLASCEPSQNSTTQPMVTYKPVRQGVKLRLSAQGFTW